MAIFLFLDYDGTLVPFKPKPEQARPTKELKALLKRLANKKNLRVAIISGRSMPELKSFFPFKGLTLVALHGLEVEFPKGRVFVFKKAKASTKLIKEIDKESRKRLAGFKGALFQNKKYGFTLHFRNAPKNQCSRLKREFKRVVKCIDKKSQLEVIPGALVLEARPKGWDKGKAVNMLLKQLGWRKNDAVIFIGDDFTDEDAFRALRKKGLTFLVSAKKKNTNAFFRIKSPAEVLQLLQTMC